MPLDHNVSIHLEIKRQPNDGKESTQKGNYTLILPDLAAIWSPVSQKA